MPAEFQKAIDYNFIGPQNTYFFQDDTIIVSTGSDSDHNNYVTKSLKQINKDNLGIISKMSFFMSKNEWPAYKFTQTSVLPLESKTAAILAIPSPKTLKRLPSFRGSVHYINKFIRHLAQL